VKSIAAERACHFKQVNRQWVGSIPEEWDAAMVKLVARLESGHTPSRSVPAYWENCTIPWFSLGDVWQLREEKRKYVYETAEKVSELGVANSSARVLPAGTVMLSRTASVGFTGIMGNDMATTQDFVNWVCGDKLKPEYLWYCLQAMTPEFDRLRFGSTHQTIYMPDVAQFKIPIPPSNEQERICNYLDEQTARIDALIAEKERLVERLGELGTSRLAHEMAGGGSAVNATHYEWYPKVPESWRVLPFKHAVHFVEGPGILAHDFRDAGVPLLRVSSVRGAVATLDGCNYLDPEKVAKTWKHFQVKPGDLLISASASMGTVSLVTEDTEGAVPYTGIIILRAIDGMATRDFIRNFVVSDQFMRQIDIMKAGATIQHFGPTHLNRIVMAAPISLVEQNEVAKRLDVWRAQQASLTAHVNEHIDRLREYRSSLISAAVTGQLVLGTSGAKAA
jgi:type I restriction enzyme S subunit